MTPSKLALRTGIAAVALTALGLVAATPASAHTNNMFTYVNYDSMSEQSGFATYSKTDGTATALPTTFVPVPINIQGIEVAGEKGTVVGFDDGGNYVRTWNHTTGERSAPMATYVPDAELNFTTGLDTLNDGRTITIARYETTEVGVDHRWAIATVSTGDGQIVPIVDLTAVVDADDDELYEFSSLATDPATGITYVFLQSLATEVYFLAVDVAAGTVGVPTPFQGEFFDDGQIVGADFDVDGTLYFNFVNIAPDGLRLLRLGAPSTWVLSNPTIISVAPAQPTSFIDRLALTIEHTALADTGSELPIAAWLIVGAVAVLAGGVTVMTARRRSGAVV